MLKRIIILMLIITSCENITEGKVISKTYEKSRIVNRGTPVMSGKTVVTIYRVVHIPEKHFLIIKGVTKKGNTLTKRLEVSKNIYNTTDLGDNYIIDKCN